MTAQRALVSAALAAGLGAGALALGQLLPATSSLRRARNHFMPGLAGVGCPGHLALTFDDGPDRSSTPAFLDALDALGWRATFFMLANMANEAPEVAAEVAKRGHEVAVHGSRHSNHLLRGPLWVARDIERARDQIAELTGAQPRWVRPPYGALSASTLYAARRAKLRPVLWTTWGRDWRLEATSDSIAGDVSATLVPGATVLLHDSDCTSAAGSWKATLAALPLLADMWEDKGLTVGPLSDHGL
ncbi:MAG TPA: polysaccharide deacetylase family protein [Acidimicrobiales bacterium]|nr:polysaccharide deacetylase family protein [Acidimicrobiales bacterium]